MKNKFIIILLCILFLSCRDNSIQKENYSAQNTKHSDSIPTNLVTRSQVQQFELVQNYIRENGKTRQFNASSSLQHELIISYSEIKLDSFTVAIDHTDRIYFSLKDKHFANMVRKDSVVVPEANYGIPNPDLEDKKWKKDKIKEVYEKLLGVAVN